MNWSGVTIEDALNPPLTQRADTSSVRLISAADDAAIRACYQLRFQYFVTTKGWIDRSLCPDGIESDFYDVHSFHLGTGGPHKVEAYLRILPFNPEIGFMLDRELSVVLSPEQRLALPRENSVELSRLVFDGFRNLKGEFHPVELLLKRLYHLSLERNYERFYIVVEASWLKPFARRFGLPFRILGQPHVFPDGTETVAAVATREELEAGMRSHSQAKYDWYRDGFVP